MKVRVIKKKASNLKEVTAEEIVIPEVETLSELLIALCTIEYTRLQAGAEDKTLDAAEIEQLAKLGKVSSNKLFNNQMKSVSELVKVMLQDFEDGLFRVYLNKKECLDLDEKLEFKGNDEIVLIRLVMLAGRLW